MEGAPAHAAFSLALPLWLVSLFLHHKHPPTHLLSIYLDYLSIHLSAICLYLLWMLSILQHPVSNRCSVVAYTESYNSLKSDWEKLVRQVRYPDKWPPVPSHLEQSRQKVPIIR